MISPDTLWAVLSPDGEKIGLVASRKDDDGVLEYFLEVIPVGRSEPLMSTSWRDFFSPRWRPDGQALTYIVYRDGQLWLQPLDGGPPEQLTHFDHGSTISHAWSSDGKWLYLARGEITQDAVLIRDF